MNDIGKRTQTSHFVAGGFANPPATIVVNIFFTKIRRFNDFFINLPSILQIYTHFALNKGILVCMRSF